MVNTEAQRSYDRFVQDQMIQVKYHFLPLKPKNNEKLEKFLSFYLL